jgi:hypothetical protein
MPKLTRKTRIRIEILRGEDLLLARDMEVRSHADLEVGVADTLRQHRLNAHELEPMWESAIKVTRLGLA